MNLLNWLFKALIKNNLPSHMDEENWRNTSKTNFSEFMAEPENVCEEAQVESDKIKAEANEQFKSERYDKAIELYSKVNS